MRFNEARKLSDKQKKMYVAVNDMRRKIGDTAMKHYKKSFDDEGFTDITLKKWKPLKREREVTYRGGKILSRTERLKNSLKKRVMSSKTEFSFTIFSNLIYADIHNWGMWGKAWGKHRFKMPKRQFIGYSRILDKKLEAYFKMKTDRIFK